MHASTCSTVEYGLCMDARSWSVRTATEKDLWAVLRLYSKRVGPAGRLAADVSTGQRRMWRRMMVTDNLTVYLAEDGDCPVGTASMILMPNLTYDCRPAAFVEPVIVAPAYRRRGVGRMMVKRAVDDARAAGCHKVQIVSHKRHAEDGAHDFYKDLGFQPEAEGFRLYLDPRGEETIAQQPST